MNTEQTENEQKAAGGLIGKVKDTETGKKLLEDSLFRAVVTGILGMGWDLIYAVFNAVLAVQGRSFWFATMAAYYFLLGCMRASVLPVGTRRDKRSERTVTRHTGEAMLFVGVVLSGMVCLTVAEEHHQNFGVIVVIAMATYTFLRTGTTVHGAVKALRDHSVKLFLLRNISLISVIGSVLALQRTMLGTFGVPGARSYYIMEGVSGLGAFVIVVGIGISVLVKAHKMA